MNQTIISWPLITLVISGIRGSRLNYLFRNSIHSYLISLILNKHSNRHYIVSQQHRALQGKAVGSDWTGWNSLIGWTMMTNQKPCFVQSVGNGRVHFLIFELHLLRVTQTFAWKSSITTISASRISFARTKRSSKIKSSRIKTKNVLFSLFFSISYFGSGILGLFFFKLKLRANVTIKYWLYRTSISTF